MYEALQKIYKNKNSKLLKNGFPKIWTKDLLKIHNCMICSSVLVDKKIIDKAGLFIVKKYADDYEYWLRLLKHTNSVYVSDLCFYYDSGHGDGQNYSSKK